jgi:hypothetical protein
MKATITGKGDNKVLVIEIPMNAPRESKSGNTLLVASTGGFAVTDAKVDGKPIKVSVNATIPVK